MMGVGQDDIKYDKHSTLVETSKSATTMSSTSTTTTCPQNILNEIEKRTGTRIVEMEECKSAQQQVWIITTVKEQASEWEDVICAGQNRLVVRVWKGGCQWWNLHQNLSPHELAQTELLGYQLGRQALTERGVTIPRVLFSQSSNTKECPWAVQ